MCEECKEIENEVKVKKSKEKVREVYTDELPRRGKTNQINWKASIGYNVEGIYDNLEFEVKIVDYDGKYLSIKYKNKEPFKIKTNNFSRCVLGELLKEELYTYTYDKTNPRRVDLRGLPLNSKGIDWSEVAKDKMKIPFVYDNIIGEVEVVGYKRKKQKLSIKYLDKNLLKLKQDIFQIVR